MVIDSEIFAAIDRYSGGTSEHKIQIPVLRVNEAELSTRPRLLVTLHYQPDDIGLEWSVSLHDEGKFEEDGHQGNPASNIREALLNAHWGSYP